MFGIDLYPIIPFPHTATLSFYCAGRSIVLNVFALIYHNVKVDDGIEQKGGIIYPHR